MRTTQILHILTNGPAGFFSHVDIDPVSRVNLLSGDCRDVFIAKGVKLYREVLPLLFKWRKENPNLVDKSLE